MNVDEAIAGRRSVLHVSDAEVRGSLKATLGALPADAVPSAETVLPVVYQPQSLFRTHVEPSAPAPSPTPRHIMSGHAAAPCIVNAGVPYPDSSLMPSWAPRPVARLIAHPCLSLGSPREALPSRAG